MNEENKDEENQLTPVEESPWGEFLWLMTYLDETSENPNGWYWLIGIHYLLGITIKRMQNNLLDDHPLKSAPLPGIGEEQALKPIISKLKERLGNPKIITKIDFSNLDFKHGANFSNLIFPITVFFSNSKFHDKVTFNRTESFISAEFNGACFSSTTQFIKARLSVAEFQKTVFYDSVNFSNATFAKLVDFRGTVFFNYARFNDATFLGHTNFISANFKEHPPHFYNVKFTGDITWRNAKWPSMNIQTHPDLIDQNQTAYENLAYHMKTLEKYHDEHFFFRQEMRCRRKLEKNPFILLSYLLYEKCANYGYGIERAILAWALHIFIGFLVITFIAMCGGIRYHESLSCAISVSFANANPYAFFGFDNVQLTGCYEMFNVLAPIIFAIIKVIQTIVGVGLLFLVLLTLRIRFRLK